MPLVQDAQHAVNECLDEYNAMLNQLDEAKKAEVMRSMGMKMEQVRASRRVPPCWPPGWKEILRSGGCSVKRRAFEIGARGWIGAQLKGEFALILDSLTHDEELPSSGRKDEG